MTRLFCVKHNRIINAYPKSLYDKKHKGKNLISKSKDCNCEFVEDYIKKFRVYNKVTFYLKDGRELKKINPNTQIEYEIIKV